MSTNPKPQIAPTGAAERFDSWAILELFGHQRIAGRVTEQTIGGCHFLRVDVPALPHAAHAGEGDGVAAFTKFFTQGAIYALTPTDKATAIRAAEHLVAQPIEPWIVSPRPQLPGPDSQDEEVAEAAADRNEDPDEIETTYSMILLAGAVRTPYDDQGDKPGPKLTPEIWRTFTEQQRQEASQWAGAVHLRASDNDDVQVPPRPACLDPYCDDPRPPADPLRAANPAAAKEWA